MSEAKYTTENKVRCDACLNMVQAESVNTTWADNGWILDIDSFGYYGGFHDGFPKETTRLFIMCQGCVKKMISLFPTMTNWIDGFYDPDKDIYETADEWNNRNRIS